MAILYLIYAFFVLFVIVQMVLRLALIDILLALAPMALGLWILPHTSGWGRHWLRLFMTTVFQQAIQLIALAMALAFLNEVAGMLGNTGTFDSWISTLYFGMALPRTMLGSARAVGLIGGALGGRRRFGGWRIGDEVRGGDGHPVKRWHGR